MSSRDSAQGGSGRPLLSVHVPAAEPLSPASLAEHARALGGVTVTESIAEPGAAGATELLDRHLHRAGAGGHTVLQAGAALAAELLGAALDDFGEAPSPLLDTAGWTVLRRRLGGRVEPVCANVDPADPLRTRARPSAEQRIYLVRHGECAIPTPDGRLHSHCDFPLTARGRAQVAALREKFAALPDAVLLGSTIPRAVESASAIAGGRKVTLSDGLVEISLGDYEGATIEEVYAVEPRFLRGGDACLPGGETPEEVGARASSILRDALRPEPAKSIVAVTHGGTNRALIAALLGIPIDSALQLRQDWAGVTILEMLAGEWRLAMLNWTPFGLDELPFADASWRAETAGDAMQEEAPGAQAP